MIMNEKNLKFVFVFYYFEEICKVFRFFKREEKIIVYLKVFGREYGLEIKIDEVGNVLIKKFVILGKENLKIVILQFYIDMVCEKNSDVEYDFLIDFIEIVVDGEWLKVKGIILGVDNGIGVVIELVILVVIDIEYGLLECFFMVDEEIGLIGVFVLKLGFMIGDILINLDLEDEGELFIGCVGGVNIIVEFIYQFVFVLQDYFYFCVVVKGLIGGYFGDDINKGRVNVNKLLNCFLIQLVFKYILYLCEIDGGNLYNVIFCEVQVLCVVFMKDKELVCVDLNIYIVELENEYVVIELNLRIEFFFEFFCKEVIDMIIVGYFLRVVYVVYNGVYVMSQDILGLVEILFNFVFIKQVEGNKIKIVISQCSFIFLLCKDMFEMICFVFFLGGVEVIIGEGYLGWKLNMDFLVLKVVVDSYKKFFGVEFKVKVIYVGLECGLFFEKYLLLDMVFFGFILCGVYLFDECMLIFIVDKFWCYLLDVLVNILIK